VINGTDDNELVFESRNVEAYRLLLKIEVALREFLRDRLISKYGQKWHKRIPGKYLVEIRKSQSDESKRKQFDFLRLGPLYYLTFGELLEFMDEGDGREAAVSIGGAAMLNQLRLLLLPRNAIAHCRDCSQIGLEVIRNTYSQLVNALTEQRFSELLKSPDVGIRPEIAMELLKEALSAADRMLSELRSPCVICQEYNEARAQFWWGDKDLAGFDTEVVDSAIRLILQYNELPTGLGSAGLRQRFIEETGLPELIRAGIGSVSIT